MLGSNVLDLVIGLVFVYFVGSLLCSIVKEAIAGARNWRGEFLERGIKSMLLGNGADLSNLLKHPLIQGLAEDGRKPAYIPAASFRQALLDLGADPDAPISTAQTSINKISNPAIKHQLTLFLAAAGNDVEAFHRKIESWFNDSMDRISGSYKRHAQSWLFVIALGVAIGANIDTVTIIRHLGRDTDALQHLTKLATESAKKDQKSLSTEDLAKSLRGIDLDMGWPAAGQPAAKPCNLGVWASWLGMRKFPGWLASALAFTLGSSFWFDLLGKLVNLRSSGPKPDQKPASIPKVA